MCYNARGYLTGVIMNERLHTIDVQNLYSISGTAKQQAIRSLESGNVVYLPASLFALQPNEQHLLSESILDPRHKNISYDYCHQRLSGVVTKSNLSLTISPVMQQVMHRFAEFTKQLLDAALPQYSEALRWGRTSYRPAEIKGRKTSKRKDDTRLHVDSFSASPVNGLRILRVFCNINPYDEPRVWHLGDPVSDVLATFSPRIPPFSALRAKLLKLIKATKTLRSPYDHYMLHLHDTMKLDDRYQQELRPHRIEFPAQSTWIVFTDHVSHAALSGQFLLEQTFYLPVSAMENPELSPLKQWEKNRSCILA